MNKEEMAKLLNGRQYRKEMEGDIQSIANEAGLIVIYGASDDLMEFAGVIYDEFGCYDGGTAYLNTSTLSLFKECDDYDCPHNKKAKEGCKSIEAIFDNDTGYCWTYKTEISHATFEIFEDDEKYCRGIVFHIEDLRSSL